MTQLTIRGFDDDLEKKIRALAKAEGISLNQAVLRILRTGAGLGTRRNPDRIGDSLDDLAGTWSAEEERRFLESIQPFESIDETLWR